MSITIDPDNPISNDNNDSYTSFWNNLMSMPLKDIIQSETFKTISLYHILFNSLLLMAETNIPGDVSINNPSLAVLWVLDVYFTAFFVFECCIKLYALGIYANPDAYFRDTWNNLDFAVALLAVINFIPGMTNLTFLRSFRLLRSLTGISKLPSLQSLVNALVQSIGSLLDSFLLLFFFLFIFSMISMQSFGGLLRYRCYDAISGKLLDSINDGPICSVTSFQNALYLGVGRQCTSAVGQLAFCADSGYNPDAGFSNWDNFLSAMLNNFIMITAEGWSSEMYYLEDAVSKVGADLFVVSLMICLYVFFAEIFMAVLEFAFCEARGDNEEKEKLSNSNLNTPRSTTAFSFSNNQGKAGTDLNKIHNLSINVTLPTNNKPIALPPQAIELAPLRKSNMLPPINKMPDSSYINIINPIEEVDENNSVVSNDTQKFIRMQTDTDKSVTSQTSTLLINVAAKKSESFPSINAPEEAPKINIPPLQLNKQQSLISSATSSPRDGYKTQKSLNTSRSTQSVGTSDNKFDELVDKIRLASFEESLALSPLPFQCPDTTYVDLNDLSYITLLQLNFHIALYNVSWICRYIVSSKIYDIVSFFCLITNSTMLMTIYYGMDENTLQTIDSANMGFLIFYIVEIVIKFFAYDYKFILRQMSIVFDIVVVLASVIEFFAGGSGGAISALRIFRLIVLAQVWPAMAKLFKMVTMSVRDFFYVSILVLIFIFVFAMFGYSILGGKMYGADGKLFRMNFDSFGWACVTVFQLMTPENNDLVVKEAIRAIGYGGALYVVFTVLLGHYIIEEIFGVILLGNIQMADEDSTNIIAKQFAFAVNRFLDRLKGKPLDPMESIIKLIKEKRARMSAKVVPLSFVTKVEVEDNEESSDKSSKKDDDVDSSIIGVSSPERKHSMSDRLLLPFKNTKQLSTNSITVSNSEGSLNNNNNHISHVERVVSNISMQSYHSAAGGIGAASPTEQYSHLTINRLKSIESIDSSAAPATPLAQFRNLDSPHAPITPSNRALTLFKEQNSKRMQITNPAYSLISQLGISAPMTRRAPSTPLLNKKLLKGKYLDADAYDESENVPLGPSKGRRASISSVASSMPFSSITENDSAGTNADSNGSKTMAEVSKHPFGTDFKFNLKNNLNPSLWVQSQHEFGNKPPSYASPPTERLLSSFHRSIPMIPVFHHHPPVEHVLLHTPCYPSLDNDDYSLFIFSTQSSIRMFAHDIITHPGWSSVIIMATLLSCFTCAMDDSSLIVGSSAWQQVFIVDLVVSVFFMIDLVFHFVAFGVIFHPNSYLRMTYWNYVDVIVALSSFSYIFLPGDIALKCIRSLRFIKITGYIRSTRFVFAALLNALAGMAVVFVFVALVMLAFAVIGVQFFKGYLGQCLLPPNGDLLYVSISECVGAGGIWTNPLINGNFDNIFNSLLFLFELMTEENWPTLMVALVDAPGPGLPPVQNYNQWNGLFFVTWVFIGSWFLKNLFSGYAITAYTNEYYNMVGNVDLTNAQAKWLKYYKTLVDLPPPFLYSRPLPSPLLSHSSSAFIIWLRDIDLAIRRFAFKIVINPLFESSSFTIILINVIAMALNYYDEPHSYALALLWINYVCTLYFACELIILLLGIGPKNYFHLFWNVIDFIVVVVTLIDFIVFLIPGTGNLFINISFLRTLRLLRALRVLRNYKRFTLLLRTLIYSLPRLYIVSLFTFLIYSACSIIFMVLFANVKYGKFLDRHGNFSSYGVTMVTLFRCMTGENWNGLMRDTMVQPPFCNPALGECGYPILAPIVHCSFQVISSLLLINLVVSVVLEQFEEEMMKIEADDDDELFETVEAEEQESQNDDELTEADLKSLNGGPSPSRRTSMHRSSSVISKTASVGNLLQDEASVKEFSQIWAAFSHEYGSRLPINRLPGFFRLLMRCNPLYRLLIRPEESDTDAFNINSRSKLKIKQIEKWCSEENSIDIGRMEIWDLIDALSLPCDGLSVHYFDIAYRLTWYCHCRKQENTFRKHALRSYFVDFATKKVDKEAYLNDEVYKSMRGFFFEVQESAENDRIHIVRATAHRNWSEIARADDWKYPAFLVWRVVFIQRMWRGTLVRRIFKKIITAYRENKDILEDY